MSALGRYFAPNEARFVPARATVVPKRVLRIETDDGVVLSEGPARGMRASPRLASLTRRIALPDGARFETEDNDGVDALLWKLWRLPRGKLTARLERAWPVVAAVLVASLAAGYLLAVRTAPAATERLAKVTLSAMAHPMSEQALLALDRYALWPTGLSAAEQARANALFAQVAAHGKGGVGAYRLVLRGGWRIGPSAFALPDGTVVVTDKLWTQLRDDDEAAGVFAREISHVDHAHQLQRVYQVALWPAAVATLTGDISRMSEMAANLPGLIAQSPVPAGFERQADDDAATALRAMGRKPSHLAALLERLARATCSGKFCPMNWAGTDAVARAARLRAQDVGVIADACTGGWQGRLTLRCLGLAR